MADRKKQSSSESLGRRLKALRKSVGLTLEELSSRSNISKASLSKVENDKMSLTYAKLQSLSRGLGVQVSELFHARDGDAPFSAPVARRSVDRAKAAETLHTHHYRYTYLHTDLLHREMTPFRMVLRSRSIQDFGELIKHPGEEFIVVIDGEVEVHTEQYSPVRLKAGDTLYIDSTMGHAYLSVGRKDATIICVCTSDNKPDERGL